MGVDGLILVGLIYPKGTTTFPMKWIFLSLRWEKFASVFKHVDKLRITPLGDNLTHQLKRLFHIQTRHDLFRKIAGIKSDLIMMKMMKIMMQKLQLSLLLLLLLLWWQFSTNADGDGGLGRWKFARARRKVQNEGGNADEADFPELLGITLRAWRACDCYKLQIL